MRAKSTRIILLTGYPEVENPGGIIAPGASSIVRNARSERTLIWNIQTDEDVPGTVEINRSILWDVQEESGPQLVNYIEVPFFQENWHDSTNGLGNWIRTISRFQGLVRLWASGTIEFAGEVATTDPTNARDYRIATGVTTGTATNRVVGTAPISAVYPSFGDWQAVSFSYRLGAGENLYLFVEPGNLQENILAYPGGWQLPFTQYGAVSGGAAHVTGEISRSGDDLVSEGTWATGGITSASGGVVSRLLDISTWTQSDTVVHLSGGYPSGGAFGPFSKTIPDSPTQGALFDHQIAAGTGLFTVSCKAMYGPIFREAYSTPTIQQGIDPIP